jgi:hypothetical protein
VLFFNAFELGAEKINLSQVVQFTPSGTIYQVQVNHFYKSVAQTKNKLICELR